MNGNGERGKKAFKIFVIIFIGIILFFSKEENQERFIGILNEIGIGSMDLEVVESISLEGDMEDIAYYDGRIIKWGNNRLGKFKLDGSKEWEKEFNLNKTGLTFGKRGIYIFEKGGGDIYLLNPSGETIKRVGLEDGIIDIVESNNYLLIHSKDLEGERINILDMDGNIIAENFIDSKNILTCCIDEEGTSYALSLLNLLGDNIKSEVHIFHIGGQLLSTSSIDDEILLFTQFVDDNKLIAMSDKALYFINRGNILWKKSFQLIKDIKIEKDKIHILYGNTLETISLDGRTEARKSFNQEYKKILPMDKYIVLYGDEYLIGLKNGEELFKHKMEDNIIKIIGGGKRLILVYQDRIDVLG
ncbi:MAG: hypothetical protein GXY88_00600 [Tissierellia bacterium]|nr:hypothetical protein [Tissierellia bacterium]